MCQKILEVSYARDIKKGGKETGKRNQVKTRGSLLWKLPVLRPRKGELSKETEFLQVRKQVNKSMVGH